MSLKSTEFEFGWGAQIFHWLSAVAIILMFPLGFTMQAVVNESARLFLYRVHVVLGIAILILTLLRIGWRWIESQPDLPPGYHRYINSSSGPCTFFYM